MKSSKSVVFCIVMKIKNTEKKDNKMVKETENTLRKGQLLYWNNLEIDYNDNLTDSQFDEWRILHKKLVEKDTNYVMGYSLKTLNRQYDIDNLKHNKDSKEFQEYMKKRREYTISYNWRYDLYDDLTIEELKTEMENE